MKAELKDRLKYAMTIKSMKAIDVANASGIPKNSVSYYLSGRSVPKSDRIYVLAKLLDVSEAWLMGFDVAMERSAEQKDVDETVALFNRIEKDREFKRLMLRINRLTSAQLEAVKGVLAAFPE
jgi:transcriptional regulator with XRE-family HTH domain